MILCKCHLDCLLMFYIREVALNYIFVVIFIFISPLACYVKGVSKCLKDKVS